MTQYKSFGWLLADTWSGTTHAVAPFPWLGALIIAGGAFLLALSFVNWTLKQSSVLTLIAGVVGSLTGLVVGAGQSWIDFFNVGDHRVTIIQACYWLCGLLWLMTAYELVKILSLKDLKAGDINIIPVWIKIIAKVANNGGLGLIYLGTFGLVLMPADQSWGWKVAALSCVLFGFLRFGVAAWREYKAVAVSKFTANPLQG